jgi:hypothetical protein
VKTLAEKWLPTYVWVKKVFATYKQGKDFLVNLGRKEVIFVGLFKRTQKCIDDSVRDLDQEQPGSLRA